MARKPQRRRPVSKTTLTAKGAARPAEFGPYHRIFSTTQTDELGEQMRTSGELWGKGSRLNGLPAVKAYDQALPEGAFGVEFYTDVCPHDDEAPTGRRFWYAEDEGVVVVNDDYVKIPIVVTRYVPRRNESDSA